MVKECEEYLTNAIINFAKDIISASARAKEQGLTRIANWNLEKLDVLEDFMYFLRDHKYITSGELMDKIRKSIAIARHLRD